MREKYVLNIKTGTLHKVNGCCHSTAILEKEFFKTENAAISKHQKHIKYCKLCFKDR